MFPCVKAIFAIVHRVLLALSSSSSVDSHPSQKFDHWSLIVRPFGFFFKTRLATINQLFLGRFNCLHTLTGKCTNVLCLNWLFILKITLILAYLLLLSTHRREFMRLADICDTADSVFCWLVGWNLTASTMYICGIIYSLTADCKTDHYYAVIVVRFIAIAAMLLPPAMLNSEVNCKTFLN